MRRTFGVAALAIFCSVYVPLAQGRPNFAGNWALADPNTRASGGVMFVGLAFTAEQDDRTLTVTPTLHQIHRDERPEQLKAVHNLDGSERTNPFDIHAAHGMIGMRTSRATWDADRLVITISTGTEFNSLVQTQTWFLEVSGILTIDSVLTVHGKRPKPELSTRGNRWLTVGEARA